MDGSIIIKLQGSVNPQKSGEKVELNRLVSSISPVDFIKLLRKADNKVNPRSAKVGKTTKSILETLDVSPELFWFKSKGLLLATKNLDILDRNRVRISLDDKDFEGIMDGGHNTLAIAVFFVERLFDKKIKDWEECKEFWDENYDDIVEKFQKNEVNLPNFSIPVEVIYPTEDEGALDQYYNFISEICEARNNNVELTEASKGNQVGLYTDLKKNLDGFFDVIWKSGDSGKIKSEEVISMATIPLLLLQENELLPADIGQLNPISIYSQKGKCVDFFNAVMEHKHISDKENGKHVLNDSYIKSGLALVQDILRFFDKVYVEFPRLYNKLSPGFGRMKSVDDKKAKLATFRTSTCDYSYPPAFMYPLIAGVTELIEIDYDAKELRWKKSPMSINLEKLDLAQYIEGIKLANYDPQKVGKQGLFYGLSKTIFKDYLSKN